MKNIRLAINLDRCNGTGVCVLSAPQVFDQSNDGKVFVITGVSTEENIATIREAVGNCPTRALSLEERE